MAGYDYRESVNNDAQCKKFDSLLQQYAQYTYASAEQQKLFCDAMERYTNYLYRGGIMSLLESLEFEKGPKNYLSSDYIVDIEERYF